MKSEKAWDEYRKACLNAPKESLAYDQHLLVLWHRWQDALKEEGKFHVKGKEVVQLTA